MPAWNGTNPVLGTQPMSGSDPASTLGEFSSGDEDFSFNLAASHGMLVTLTR